MAVVEASTVEKIEGPWVAIDGGAAVKKLVRKSEAPITVLVAVHERAAGVLRCRRPRRSCH